MSSKNGIGANKMLLEGETYDIHELINRKKEAIEALESEDVIKKLEEETKAKQTGNNSTKEQFIAQKTDSSSLLKTISPQLSIPNTNENTES